MRYVLMCAILLLPGCSTLSPYVERYAELSDDVFEGMLAYKCRGIRIGVWMRHYGSSPAKAEAWRTECAPADTALPVASVVR